ncbi:MAG: ribose-phosphate diphosphokinase [Spirochaetaceae bacterium]|jgi:ribose-phosphate pyrophosphokinase|nr:ribose-phosphate diphosphokinase [Spirochaetaceae bacterium]
MYYWNPANLAVVACPGAEAFAEQVTVHLKTHYRRIFEKAAVDMSKRYAQPVEEITRRINFISEIVTPSTNLYHENLKPHTPKFKVPVRFSMFANGEFKCEILNSIRGKDVFIFQDMENHCPLKINDGTETWNFSVNDHLIALYVTIDAAVQAAAEHITVVLPTYPYSRQHKRKGREGLTASRIGYILEMLGVNRIITLDIHSRELVNGFHKVKFENLHASHQIIKALFNLLVTPAELDNFVIVSPDTGAVDRNKFYATALKKPLALLYKERDYSHISKNAGDNNIAVMKLLGDVHGKNVFMADDMLGTGGTMLKAMKFLKDEGAGKVIAAISLPLFSGDAIKFFDDAYKQGYFYRIIGTNAVTHGELLKREWYVNVNISKLFAQVILRLHQKLSLSSLLDNREVIIKSVAAKEHAAGSERQGFLFGAHTRPAPEAPLE